jgi:hypothetical protein
MYRMRIAAVGAVVTALVIGACQKDETTTGPGGPILAGLSEGNSNDTTVGNPAPGTTTPGSFHGYVIGRGTPPDTFATAPRIQGATITAYPHLGYDGDTPRMGDPVGSVQTDASGFFQFPEIPGGAYVVTVTPPSGFLGQYITTTISNVSNSGNWWVVLTPK